jgi:outer membrane protein
MKRLRVATLLATCAFGAAAQPPAPPLKLTLLDALTRAMTTNASVERARAEVSAADAQKRGYLSLVLPRLTATGNLTRNTEEVSFGTDTDRRIILPENDWKGQITLNQPVFAGLREKRAYQQSKEALVSARDGVVGAEDRAVFRVATEYMAAAEAEAILAVEKQTLALARKRRKQAQDLFEAGETTRVDVLRADTAIKASERRIAAAERDRENAIGLLRIDLTLDGPIEIQEPAVPMPVAPSEADLIANAEAGRSDLRQAKSALRIAELEIQKQSGAYLPVVTADAGYIWQKTSFPTSRYGYAALRFTVPLFTGGEVGSKVAFAKEREKQAQLSYDEALRTVREDVRRALLDARTAATQVELSAEQLSAAEAEYKQVFEQYQSQEITSLDVAASEATLADARRTVATDRLNRQLSELGIWYSVGGLGSQVRKTKEMKP